MKTVIYLVVFILLGFACSSRPDNAQDIIDSAIAAHGGEKFRAFNLNFTFRDKQFGVYRNGGLFTYSRQFTDSLGTIKDELSNQGFTRFINGVPSKLPEDRAQAYQNSVNSVVYFALLPFGLNDAAVIKAYKGEQNIKEGKYFLVEVKFKQEGGGTDFQDEFLYWFNSNTYLLDYMAYSFQEKNKEGHTITGYRFRQAINRRTINGLIIQDYINYKPANKSDLTLYSLQQQYSAGELEELSRIALEKVQVHMQIDTKK